ncbi:hypothetical protein G7Z17_g1436 [Cylindrodendrum hubeiense]|uniref:DUF3533 domain-containing protein n=1 Tax=Cylindrodendrum hubeiense TaxID=595255 RepID=A0A9P5HES8_9HYPO|nr:hypothetical protein G7Z17_g1436 [Cylindrodendrum hubeiense]
MGPPMEEAFSIHELGRRRFRHPEWHGRRKSFIIPKIMMGVIILIMFLAIMSNFFGTAFRQTGRIKALKILAIDYDGGDISEAIENAYSELQSDAFPTIEFRSSSDFPDSASVRRAVCRGHYWAGIYTHSNASSRLSAALSGDDAASSYNSTDTFTYIYNQARYPTVADGQIRSGIEELIDGARSAYYQSKGGKNALTSINRSDENAVTAYLNPFSATSNLIMPTTQGTRVYYNTAFMVVPILAQFFLILAMNGISSQHNVFTHASIRDVWLIRFAIGKVYSFIGALVMTGYLWAFREDWNVTGREFVLTWLVMWLHTEVNWVLMESLIASYIPLQFISLFVVSWVMVNVASSIFPFELSPGWYRWGYALPAHETYEMLVYVWSGCANPMRVALPVMFSWLVLGHVIAWFSIRKRCLDAERELKMSSSGSEGSESN